jgi:hypothetical protein
MSSIFSNTLLTNPTFTPNITAEPIARKALLDSTHESPLTFLSDSQVYLLKGGFTAEVIQEPGTKLLRAGLLEKARQEMGDVLLSAFERGDDEAETFLGGNKFTKVGIWVDWLVVIRKKDKIMAFSTASFVAPYHIYLNAAMVRPEEQSTGIGFMASALLWKIAVEDVKERLILEPVVVCRTRNRNVVSVMLKVMNDAVISTEKDLTAEIKATFRKTADYLHCEYDDQIGISKEAYPEGLPFGTKGNNDRIVSALQCLGPRDGCFVAGHLNLSYLNRIVEHSRRKEEERCRELMTAANISI